MEREYKFGDIVAFHGVDVIVEIATYQHEDTRVLFIPDSYPVVIGAVYAEQGIADVWTLHNGVTHSVTVSLGQLGEVYSHALHGISPFGCYDGYDIFRRDFHRNRRYVGKPKFMLAGALKNGMR